MTPLRDPLAEAWESAQEGPQTHGYEPEQGTPDPLRSAWEAAQKKPKPATRGGGRGGGNPGQSSTDPLRSRWEAAQVEAEPDHVNPISDVAAQAFSGPANLVLTAGEGVARLGSNLYGVRNRIKNSLQGITEQPHQNALDRIADALHEQRAEVNEVLEPETTAGKVASVASNIGAQALPAIATGGTSGFLAGSAASAALTGVQSQAGRDASVTGMVADLTGNKFLNRVADNPAARTAADVALDVGLSGASAAVSDLMAARKARRLGQTKPGAVIEPYAATVAVPEVMDALPEAAQQVPPEIARAVDTSGQGVAHAGMIQPYKPLTVPIETPLGGIVGGPTPSDMQRMSVLDAVKRKPSPEAELDRIKRALAGGAEPTPGSTADIRPPIDLTDMTQEEWWGSLPKAERQRISDTYSTSDALKYDDDFPSHPSSKWIGAKFREWQEGVRKQGAGMVEAGPVRQPPVNEHPIDPAAARAKQNVLDQFDLDAPTPDRIKQIARDIDRRNIRNRMNPDDADTILSGDERGGVGSRSMSASEKMDAHGNAFAAEQALRRLTSAEVEDVAHELGIGIERQGARGERLFATDIKTGELLTEIQHPDDLRDYLLNGYDSAPHLKPSQLADDFDPEHDFDLDRYVAESGLDPKWLTKLNEGIKHGENGIQNAPAGELYSSLDFDLKRAAEGDDDLSLLRMAAKELARRAGWTPEQIVQHRMVQIHPANPGETKLDVVHARFQDLVDKGVFEDAPQSSTGHKPGVFMVEHPEHGPGIYWRASDGTKSPPRYLQRGETVEDVAEQMREEYFSLPARLRAPMSMKVVEGSAEVAPGVRSIRTASGKLPHNLAKFSNEELEHEWARLAEQNALEESQHSAIQESGYRADYEELPRTEKLGRKGQEDLPDADGMIDAERLAADNKSISGYNRAAIVRAARERAIRRIEAELKQRGVDFGLSGETDGGVIPFSNPMFHPSTIRRALGTRLGQSAATAGVGVSLQESDDDKLQATGRGLMILAALHAVGAPRMRAAGEYVGSRTVEALKDSPAGRKILNTISRDVLADPRVRELVSQYDERVAGARARAAELSKQAKALGPAGDRAVSDIIEREHFEPLTTDQTAALAVAQQISDEFTALGKEKVAHGLLSAETVAKREGSYLPRMYAEHLGEAVRTDPRASVLGSPVKVRIKGENMRLDDLTPAARNKLGEIREASFRTAHGIEKGYRNVAAAKLFAGLRELPDVVHPDYAAAVDALTAARRSGNEAAIDAAKTSLAGLSSRYVNGTDGFRKLPDTPGLGVLRGAVVRADVADYIEGMDSIGDTANPLLTAWKRIHTVLNLPTHIGNVASNSVIAHMVGLPLWKQPAALKSALSDFDHYGPTTRFLSEKGILSHGLPTASEGVPAAGRSLKKSLTQLSGSTREETAKVLAEKGITPGGAGRRVLRSAASKLEAAYAKEDAVYRVATFDKLTGEGMDAEEAAKLVDHAFVNYNTRSPALKFTSKYLSPFILYPAKVLPFISEQITEYPWRWATLASLWGGMDQFSRHRVGKIAEEDLRPADRTNKYLGYLAPGFTQLPFEGKTGEKYGVDIARFTPFSALTGAPAPGSTTYAALGENVPGILQPNGPLLEIGARMANTDPYTGDKLIKPGDGVREKVEAFGKGAASLALPSMLSFHAPRVAADIIDRDPHAAGIDALAFLGARPRAVRPGLQRFNEQRNFEEARAQILYDLRRELRTNKSPDHAAALQAQAEARLKELAKAREEQVQRAMQSLVNDSARPKGMQRR